jgi:hypothetical protein
MHMCQKGRFWAFGALNLGLRPSATCTTWGLRGEPVTGGHQMVGRLNWMSPPSTIPAIVLSKFSLRPDFCN